ncbi:hypothetical protein HG531_007307 [Fusarium graminearum]|nr:hypothetical protein HG531_007307 [Fusarium graminearum]
MSRVLCHLFVCSKDLVNVCADKINCLLLFQPSASVLVSSSSSEAKITQLPVLMESNCHCHTSIKQCINDCTVGQWCAGEYTTHLQALSFSRRTGSLEQTFNLRLDSKSCRDSICAVDRKGQDSLTIYHLLECSELPDREQKQPLPQSWSMLKSKSQRWCQTSCNVQLLGIESKSINSPGKDQRVRSIVGHILGFDLAETQGTAHSRKGSRQVTVLECNGLCASCSCSIKFVATFANTREFTLGDNHIDRLTLRIVCLALFEKHLGDTGENHVIELAWFLDNFSRLLNNHRNFLSLRQLDRAFELRCSVDPDLNRSGANTKRSFTHTKQLRGRRSDTGHGNVVWKAIVVCLGCFKEDVLRIDDRVVTDVYDCEVIFIEDLSSVLGADVCLMSMVESSNSEFKLIGVVDHGFQVGDSIAMRVDMNLATKSSGQRFPSNLAREILIQKLNTLGLGLGTPVILLLNQVSGLFKSMTEFVTFAHTAERSVSNAAMNIFGVLTTRHFHISPVTIRVGQQILSANFFTAIGFANGMLDEIGFSADVVAGAW